MEHMPKAYLPLLTNFKQTIHDGLEDSVLADSHKSYAQMRLGNAYIATTG